MKKIFLAAVLLALSASAFSQGGATQLFPPLQGPQGTNVSFAHLTFCTSPAAFDSLGNCTNTISVFQDQGLTTPYPSGILTDGLGNFPPNGNTTTALWFAPISNACYTATGGNILHTVNICTPFSVAVTPGSSPSFAALTVTGNSTLNGGTLNGTYGGNPTLSGNVLVGGTLGVAGVTTDTGGLNVGKVIRDCRTDNVKCDGTTDDSAAITACLVNAYAAGQGAVQLPSGQCKVNTAINDTNKPSLDVYGSNSNEDYSTVTTGQNFGTTVTELICNTGSTPCWDATGTGRARFKRLGLRAAIGQTSPSQVGFLFGRDNAVSGTGWTTGTGTYCFTEENKLEDVWVFFDTRPAATAVGTVAIYNQGAEQFQIIGGGYIADSPLMFGFSNILSIASPYVTLSTGCPASMSEVKIGHGASFQPWTKQAIRIDDQMIDFETESDTEIINPNIGTNHNAAFLINTSNANNIFLRGQSESFDLPITIGGTVDRLKAELTAVSPAAGLVQFSQNNLTLTNSVLNIVQRNLSAQPLFNAASGTGIKIIGSELNEGGLSGSGTASNITVTESRITAQGLTDAAVNTFAAGSTYDLSDDSGHSIIGTLRTPGNVARVTTDFTDANSAALQAITGLSFSLPAVAVNYSFHCSLMYSQATNVAGDQFGIGVITTAPTSASAFSTVNTNATAVQYGVLTSLASTTPTAVVTFTPAVATVLGANLDGTVEISGSGASTFNIYVLNGTAANVIVVKKDSYCTLYPQ